MIGLAMASIGSIAGGPFGSLLGMDDYTTAGIPVIRGGNLLTGTTIGGDFAFVSREKAEVDLSRNFAIAGDLIFTQRGTLGQVAVVPSSEYPFYVISQSQMRLRIDPAIAYGKYVLYACKAPAFLRQLDINAIRTGVPHVNLGILARLTIPMRHLGEQQNIAEVLGALDEKIAANAELARTITDHLQALVIRGSTTTKSLDEVATFANRHRRPLSSRERAQFQGDVPYYGAAGQIDTVGRSLFDSPLVLIGEDGSVVRPDRTPYCQYVWGPSWVNNHAHVLAGAGVSTELLYFLLRLVPVDALVTGAVQPKLSMGNLKRLTVHAPTGEAHRELEFVVDSEMALVRSVTEESGKLAELRDTLLPHLMSGRLKVRDAEKAVSDAV